MSTQDVRPSKSEVIVIAAMAENRVIGANNTMPWHLSSDLKRFKALTTGHPIIMGRKTFESLGSRPLPKRRNIVLSRTGVEGAEVFSSLEAALKSCEDAPQVFVIGGAQIYETAFKAGLVDRVELTRISASPEGDTFFPEFESNYVRMNAEPAVDGETHLTFETWVRMAPA